MSAALVGGFGLALQRALWAYKGWEAVSFSGGGNQEPRDATCRSGCSPARSSSSRCTWRANLAYLYVLPFDTLIGSQRVASDAMSAAGFELGATVLGVVILCSITGAANGNVLTAPRVFFAMARDGVFFRSGSAPSIRRFLTPHVSILATGAWAMVLSVSGTFEQLADYVDLRPVDLLRADRGGRHGARGGPGPTCRGRIGRGAIR